MRVSGRGFTRGAQRSKTAGMEAYRDAGGRNPAQMAGGRRAACRTWEEGLEVGFRDFCFVAACAAAARSEETAARRASCAARGIAMRFREKRLRYGWLGLGTLWACEPPNLLLA
ncbi:hypothetical protein GUJ93_ZPchr0012g19372 [Zizania palustris]|uniref:Uncharacterized protein n=1 Tax=Zizania palustris TaxID=103762 RepID=A0A8J5WT18_ZIZPA|nr:hypothetical protein GUJ93_ZPchr0012g19372 [Zizania palustris]